MDWADIPWASIITALALAIGLPLALRARKKGGPQKVEQLLQHLRAAGIKVSQLGENVEEKNLGIGRGSGHRSEGILKVEGKSIDFINITSVAGQYGVNYFIDYLVKSPGRMGKMDRKRAKLSRKKSSLIGGKLVDVEWKGDHYLSQILNLDYQLKDRLLLAELEKLEGDISVFPEPKYEYARIRTVYLLPSTDLLEAVNIIARHIKTEW